MDYKPNYYSNRNAIDKSNRYKKKRIFWLNSSFNSDFVLIDGKIYEISFDIPPFEIYKNNRLRLLTYIRDSNQSKPIQIKLKLPFTQSSDIINSDKECFPIIYTNHSAVETMTSAFNPIIRLTPQQISRFTFRLDDNFSQFDYNSYFSSVVNGSVSQVIGGSIDDKYVIFKSNGSFAINRAVTCDILVVGGGGGGGLRNGGGGGGGAVIYITNYTLNTGTYTITIGNGGNGAINTSPYTNAQNGDDTTISYNGSILYRALGGGYGGLNQAFGNSGGSGGGGTTTTNFGTALNNNIPVNFYGKDGGKGSYAASSQGSGGGGGGAGGVGGNSSNFHPSSYHGGNGGDGLYTNICGINEYFGGGGGGGATKNVGANFNSTYGIGGLGGGGDGAFGGSGVQPKNGIINTGGGGGGCGWDGSLGTHNGAAGGSGVVIIKFREIRNEGMTPEETLIQATNSSIAVNTNSKYQINYQNPIDIPKGTYETIFSNGAITFKSKPDYTYPTTSNLPLLWYKFDGSQFLYDSGTARSNLTINGNVLSDTSIYKKGDASASFADISNEYLSGSGISISNRDFSISFWAYPISTVRGCYIFFGTDTPANEGVFISYGFPGFYTNQWAAGNYGVGGDLVSSTLSDTNTWVHITYTVNSTTKNRILYRNGVKLVEGTTTNNLSTTNTNYYLGYINGTFSRMNGKIDDFRFYDYVLSPYEIYDLYNGNTDRSYPLIKDSKGTLNPFVWYKFDTSNNLGLDDMGEHNLTNTNGVAFSTDYVKGSGCASFDGTNDYLTKDNAFNLNSINFSISLWVKKTDNLRVDRLFQLGTGLAANTSMYILYGNDNKIVFGNYAQDLVSASAYADNGSWVHLCFTYQSGIKRAIIYRNGVNVGQMNFTNEFNTNNDVRIGSFSENAFYKGLMDDFRIYKSTLTATMINELYTGRLAIYNPPAFLTGFELEDEDLIRDNTISSYK